MRTVAKALLERGKKFFTCRDQCYVTYTGSSAYPGQFVVSLQIIDVSVPLSLNLLQADTRFMIDTGAFNLYHPDETASTEGALLLSEEEIRGGQDQSFLLQLPPWINEFNMTNKAWGKQFGAKACHPVGLS